MDNRNVEIIINARDNASKTLKSVGESVSELGSSANKTGGLLGGLRNSMDNAAGASRGVLLGLTGLTVAGGLIAKSFIGIGSESENLRTNLDVLTGSTLNGAAMYKKLVDFANNTPFETGDLVKASQTMLGFGIANEKVLPNLRMLGDIAMGNKDKLSSLTLAFSQIQSTGRLMGQDLLQLINGGFNPLTIISQKTGKSMSDLKKEMEAGAISADMVTDAFTTATSKGGLYYQGMDKGAKTLSGLWSTVMDTAKGVARSMIGISETGEIIKGGLFDKVKNGVQALIPFLQKLPTMLKEAFGFLADNLPIIAGVIIGALVPAFVTLGISIWAALAPLLPFIAAGAAIGVAVQLLVKHFGGWSKVMETIKPVLKTIGSVIKDVLKPSFDALWNTIQKVLMPALKKLWNFLEPVLKPVLIALAVILAGPLVAAVVAFVAAIWLITNVINIVIISVQWLFNNVISPGIKMVVALFMGLWAVVTAVFNGIWSVIKVILDIATAAFNVWFTVISFIFKTIYAIAVWAFSAMWAYIQPVVTLIVGGVQWIGNVFNGIFNWILNIARNVWGAIYGVIQWAWNAVAGIWNQASGFFGGVWGSILGGAQWVGNSISGAFSGAWNGIRNGAAAAVNFVIDNLNRLVRGYNNTVGRIPGTPKIPEIGRFATGSQFTPAGMAMVGENGPELVSMPRGARVYNAQETKAMGGGGGNTFYGDIKLGDASAVREFFDKLGRNQELAQMGLTTMRT